MGAMLADPFIGCEFDKSRMSLVEKWEGFAVGQYAQLIDQDEPAGPVKLGIVVAIGVNARDENGKFFTAMLARFHHAVQFLKSDQLVPM